MLEALPVVFEVAYIDMVALPPPPAAADSAMFRPAELSVIDALALVPANVVPVPANWVLL